MKLQQDLKNYLSNNRPIGGGIRLHKVFKGGGSTQCTYQNLKIFAERFPDLKIGIDIQPGKPFKKGLDLGYIQDVGTLTPYTKKGWALLEKIYNGEYSNEYRISISWGYDGKPDYDMPTIIKDFLNETEQSNQN